MSSASLSPSSHILLPGAEELTDYPEVSRVSLTKIERGGDLRLSTLLKLTELLGLEVIIRPREAR